LLLSPHQNACRANEKKRTLHCGSKCNSTKLWQWAGPGLNIDIYIVLRRSTKTVIAKCLRVLSLGSRCQNSDYFAYFLVTDEKVLPLFRSPRMITLANGSCSRQNLSTLSVRQVAIAVTQIHFATLGTLPCIVFFYIYILRYRADLNTNRSCGGVGTTRSLKLNVRLWIETESWWSEPNDLARCQKARICSLALTNDQTGLDFKLNINVKRGA
jgi:hypothetical protein